MRIYIYDNETGEYRGFREAQPNPKRKGEYLFPKNSTTLVPPSLKQNEGVIFNNGKWTIVKDYRGKEIINLETKEISEVQKLGEIDSGYKLWSEYVLTDEYQKYLIAKEREERRAEILNEISELDIKRIRAVCEHSIKDESTGESWLDFYTSQIVALRSELEVI